MPSILLFLIGLALFITGVAFLSTPAALIVGGLFVMLIAAVADTDGKSD